LVSGKNPVAGLAYGLPEFKVSIDTVYLVRNNSC